VSVTSVPASDTRTSAFTSRLITAPIDPSIWEEPVIGALRVAPINPAVPGYERLAPATSVIELGLRALPGAGSPRAFSHQG